MIVHRLYTSTDCVIICVRLGVVRVRVRACVGVNVQKRELAYKMRVQKLLDNCCYSAIVEGKFQWD